MPKFKRSIILDANRFQTAILLPVLVSCVIAAICVALVVFSGNPVLKETHSYQKFLDLPVTVLFLKFLLAAGVAALFWGLVYWACYVSNRILGAHHRVLNQLDEVIFNNKKGPVHVREGDEFFDELLDRINILIEPNKEIRGERIDRLLTKKFGPGISSLKK